MADLTDDEKIAITMDTIRNQPMETIGQMALIQLSRLAIETKAKDCVLSTEATINDCRYKLSMKVTYKKV